MNGDIFPIPKLIPSYNKIIKENISPNSYNDIAKIYSMNTLDIAFIIFRILWNNDPFFHDFKKYLNNIL